MPGFEANIDGLDQLYARLEELKKEQARRIVNKALFAGAEVFQEEIAERAPVRQDLPSGTALPPGALKNDIRIKRVRAPELTSDYFAVGPGKYTARVMRWLEYGHRLVRGGHSRVLANGKTKGRGVQVSEVPPYPVMRPAFESAGARAASAVRDSLQEQFAQVRKTGGGSGS